MDLFVTEVHNLRSGTVFSSSVGDVWLLWRWKVSSWQQRYVACICKPVSNLHICWFSWLCSSICTPGNDAQATGRAAQRRRCCGSVVTIQTDLLAKETLHPAYQKESAFINFQFSTRNYPRHNNSNRFHDNSWPPQCQVSLNCPKYRQLWTGRHGQPDLWTKVKSHCHPEHSVMMGSFIIRSG